MIEVWKEIVGYENNYAVSNMGYIKNIISEKILRSEAPSADYKRIGLWKNGITELFAVHRVVAFHFIENPDNKPIVHHIDEDKWNNVYTNLKWATKKENSYYHYELVRKKISEFKVGLIANVIGTDHYSKINNVYGRLIELERPLPETDQQDFYFDQLEIV